MYKQVFFLEEFKSYITYMELSFNDLKTIKGIILMFSSKKAMKLYLLECKPLTYLFIQKCYEKC